MRLLDSTRTQINIFYMSKYNEMLFPLKKPVLNRPKVVIH